MADYLVTDSELTSIANAIRSKGGTSASLAFPSAFVSAIEDIPTGGGDAELQPFIERTISEVENSTASYVGSYAFYQAINLRRVSMTNVNTLSQNAFGYCSNLSSIYMPELLNIGNSAFAGCGIRQISEADFSKATFIRESTFAQCYSLGTVEMPKVTTIGSYAFYNCVALSMASFRNAELIYPSAFNYVYNLDTIYAPKVTKIQSAAFSGCYSLKNAVFDGVVSISASAFKQCSWLSVLSLPSLTSLVGSYIFQSCYRLISLYLLGSTRATLGNSNAFSATPIAGYTASTGGVLGSIYVPSSLYSSYITATGWSWFSSRFVSV